MSKRPKPAPVVDDEQEDDDADEERASKSDEKPKKTPKKAAAKAKGDVDEDEVEAPATRKGGPPFARHFPEDAALDALLVLFDQGNYAAVREQGLKLAKETEDEAVKRAAKELMSRVDPDPMAKLLVLGAAVLLAILSGWYWTHPHVP